MLFIYLFVCLFIYLFEKNPQDFPFVRYGETLETYESTVFNCAYVNGYTLY